MRIVSFVVVADEGVELVLAAVGVIYLPEQKGAEGIALHQAVEKAGFARVSRRTLFESLAAHTSFAG